MVTPIVIETSNPDLLVGVVEAREVPCGEAAESLAAALDAALASRARGEPPLDSVKAAIRDLLRTRSYKPTGRGKPASEYLAQAAARGEFPCISHVVDALNLVSLESGLPISLLDTDRAMEGTTGLVIRLGAAGEKYVFNSAGHEIDVEGLLCVARNGGQALGNPVKDSMASKTTPDTRNVTAIVWGSRRVVDAPSLGSICERLAGLLAAQDSSVRVL